MLYDLLEEQSDSSLWVYTCYAFLDKIPVEVILVFLSAHDTIRCVKSVCFRVDDAKFAHLVKMVSAKSPHCKVTIFYLVINK